ncbi:hypothetical protein VC83_08728 [Pseudogymnoascus destructans]|uniref:Subtelomeric hrmA-associated cluster protein AFUB-079030/YDR124W-like helical bundle domain-containing protein n=2 Tax=Pseudogymnoascus destructans TaxID=655981 RepID=L8G9M1_PSED2|nr:uncharacterized protein VC83_08728 [Pseudogymnoascus destructans]ELR09554.1 hypothetical protein GMDG_04049 [Pseudogymnoascus destructans 20631-21]OAF55007.1 hypothetical protein VC83_08728 [Pseudogymnoascus destructans]
MDTYLNNTPKQTSKNMDIIAAINEIEYASFALAIARPDGQIDTLVSTEIKTDPKLLFTPDFQDMLLNVLGRQPKTCDHAVTTLSTEMIQIGDDTARNAVYYKCLTGIQQLACRAIGKTWVKLLEPKKQERIPLLIHILGLVVSQDPNSPAQQHGITVTKLKEVTYNVMTPWFDGPQKHKHDYLSQLFCVLHAEEHFRRGKLDGSKDVSVNGNTKPIDHDNEDSNVSSEQLHQAPFFPTPPPSLSSHPITNALEFDSKLSATNVSMT